MKEQVNVLSPVKSIAPQAVTTTKNGDGVDLQGYESAQILVSIGSVGGGMHKFSVGESDDNTSFTTVAASDLEGGAATFLTVSGSSTSGVTEEAYLGTKRYIRVVDTVTGSPATGLHVGAIVNRGNPRHPPV